MQRKRKELHGWMLALDMLWVLFRHFVIIPLIKVLSVVFFLPPYLFHKSALAVAYLWSYILLSPYIIANALEPDADEWDCRNLLTLLTIFVSIIYIVRIA